ncbi:MAG: hypothetical protein LBR06_03175 [Bacteroidales bacterium]|jgi:cell division protein FtsQ|nr:hypothetical protein [Bacteroidales bacterium]
MRKNLTFIILIGVVIALAAAAAVFAWRKYSSAVCADIVVHVAKNSPEFIAKERLVAQIRSFLASADSSGKKDAGRQILLSEINTGNVEKELKKATSVARVEVFRKVYATGNELKGRLVVNVAFRQPLFRVAGTRDFYVDADGVPVYEVHLYPAHVPVVTGAVDEKYAARMLPLMKFLSSDKFWRAQIQQLNVTANGDILMAPLAGDHIIEFGPPDRFREKFRNLTALYEQGFREVGWDRYRKVSVKYRNQVVCTKK